MDTEANVAVTALVVGLAALFIAFGQFLQQIFGTADGYRRCQRSIIGPWAKKTRLVWRWSQFRFETKFTTPELVLYEEGAPVRNAIELTGERLPPEIKDTISSSVKYEESSDDTVTWILFLRQLYLSQIHGQSLQSEKQFEPPVPSVYPTTAKHQGDSIQSKIGIVYRERTWDLMPTDAIRPMASARLGAMVVLGHKLGMTWESTQTSEGYMRADGNGHSLISSMVRGLGIVFSYSSSFHSIDGQLLNTKDLQPLESKQFVNSSASEKMLCAIIPSCPALDTPELPFMGKRPTESNSLVYSGLVKCGVLSYIAEKLSRREVLESFPTGKCWNTPEAFPINDLIALVSPFMPTRGSLITRIMWPIRTVSAISAFHFWECRMILLKRLSEHSGVEKGHLKQVYAYFKQLESEFDDDFYCRKNKCLVRSENPADDEKKHNMIETLRSIHEWTTQYFQKTADVLPYLDLVGVHVALANYSARDAQPKLGRGEGGELKTFWAATASFYVDNFDRRLALPLLDKFQEHGDTVPGKDLIEDAWWTLVLRGTVWYMSVHIEYPEYMLPSKLYYDQTPVFIM